MSLPMPPAPQSTVSIYMDQAHQHSTSSETSSPFLQGAADLFALPELRPHDSCLKPIRKTIRAFSTMVDYSFYCINDKNDIQTPEYLKIHLQIILEPFYG